MVVSLILSGHEQTPALLSPNRTHVSGASPHEPRGSDLLQRGFSKSQVFLSILVLVNVALRCDVEVLGWHLLAGWELLPFL